MDHERGQVPQLCLSEEELAERKAYLEISDADIAYLKSLHGAIDECRDELAEGFYRHLLSYPQLRQMLDAPGTLERLKRAQSAYFSSLTRGEYGADYIAERLRVGNAHQRIGLDTKWYIGAYRKYISELLPIVHSVYRDDPDHLMPACDALFKIISFDMGLALDTYSEADRQEILRHKDYAEQVISLLPAGLIVLDGALQIRSINSAMRALLGLCGENPAAGLPLAKVVADPVLLDKAASLVENGGSGSESIVVALGKEEGARYLDFRMAPALLEGRTCLLMIAQDVTERIRARAQLHESEQRFRLTFSMVAIGLAHLAPDGRLLRVNPKLCDILGYSEAQLVGLNYQELAHPDDAGGGHAFFRRLLDNDIPSYAREQRFRHRDGHYLWTHNTVSLVRREDGTPRYLIMALEDISQRRAAADQLTRLAKYDSLTGLPNRVLLQDRLGHAISLAQRERKRLAVIFMDLDRFKDINDSLGHDAGDLMLVEIGRRISSQLRESDTVARLGGDEFVVLLPDPQKDEHAAMVARKILSALSAPLSIKGVEFFPTASMGISIFPQDGLDSAALLKNADTAMYQAKEKGKNNFQFYSQEMSEGILSRLKIQAGLSRALEHGEFVLHYQPILDVCSGAVVAVEALLRWRQSSGILVGPADFIPIAEEAGLILPIGRWVLREACRQVVRWAQEGLPDMKVTVNVSARQFRDDIAEAVASALEETGCPPQALTLELTETVVMEHPGIAEQTLQQLKQMGVRLAIDDFGTGHSSLNQLRRFPIDVLKIDRSFVGSIASARDKGAIVKAIIALGRAMEMQVIAEGVENGDQVEFLAAEQCKLMQGFHFSRPIPADDIPRFGWAA